MVTVEDFSRLVSGIYAAAVTPEHWEAVISDIRRAIGAAHGALLKTDGVNRSVLSTTLPVEAGTRYLAYYQRLDYVTAAVERGPVGAVRTGSELTDPRKHREFHADWCRPYPGDDGLIVRLTGGPRPTCFLVAALRRSEWFDTPERMKLMSGLVPHLQQALRTQDKLAGLAQNRDDLAAALEAVRHGIIFVGAACRVLHLNSAAENTLRCEDGIVVRAGCIAATAGDAQLQLNRAVHAAVSGDGSTMRSGRSFTCQRPSGKRPYVIHVLPVHRPASEETRNPATALVLILDPEQENQPTPTLLRQLYKFTNTEAEIALRLTHGDDLKQISDELSVSTWTIRTHLQHLFDKTDTHRQAELVRHLLAVAP